MTHPRRNGRMKSQHRPTIASLTNAVAQLIEQNTRLTAEVYEVKRQLRKESLREALLEVAAEEMARQKKLAHDVNGLMEMLLEKGLVTKNELSEACRS